LSIQITKEGNIVISLVKGIARNAVRSSSEPNCIKKERGVVGRGGAEIFDGKEDSWKDL